MRRAPTLLGPLLSFGLAVGSPAGAADEDLYDLDIIRTISLVFDSPGFFIQLEQVSGVAGQYLVADLVVDGVTYPGVGVRFRGNTSQRNVGQKFPPRRRERRWKRRPLRWPRHPGLALPRR